MEDIGCLKQNKMLSYSLQPICLFKHYRGHLLKAPRCETDLPNSTLEMKNSLFFSAANKYIKLFEFIQVILHTVCHLDHMELFKHVSPLNTVV